MNTQLRERLSARFVARLCEDTIEVHRCTMTADGRGGVTQDWRKIGTHRGRLINKADQESIPGGGIEATASWSLLVSVDADVLPRDRVYRPGQIDQYWEVAGTDAGQTELLIQHIDLQERTV